MARYPNGGIPANLLVEVGPYHWLTAATAARWRALVADVKKNEGVTLRITPGKNAYRDRPGQVFARNNACAAGRCNDAAVPGTSSHGGEYQGRDSLAIDVDNWAVLGKAKFYAYCRKHGFEPGFFDWEPWHIIDWNPWVMPAPAKKEDDMAVEDLHTHFAKKGGQPVKAGQKVNLHINDAKDVTVVRGAAKHVSGNLAFALSGGKAYSGAVQVTPVVRDYKDGKEVKRTSLRARETVFTGGDTLGEVAVNCALKAGQRLSFEIGGSAQDFTVKSAVFRGMKIT